MKIKVKRKIEASQSELWKYLGDYANISKFHPLLKGSHATENPTCEVGGTRQCDMKNGDYLKERITEWKEGEKYSIEIYETNMPVKNARASLGLKRVSDNQTIAYMHLEMKAKYKIMTPVLYLMFKFHAAPGILKGLDKVVNEEKKLALA
jgi:hypothetical protein